MQAGRRAVKADIGRKNALQKPLIKALHIGAVLDEAALFQLMKKV